MSVIPFPHDWQAMKFGELCKCENTCHGSNVLADHGCYCDPLFRALFPFLKCCHVHENQDLVTQRIETLRAKRNLDFGATIGQILNSEFVSLQESSPFPHPNFGSYERACRRTCEYRPFPENWRQMQIADRCNCDNQQCAGGRLLSEHGCACEPEFQMLFPFVKTCWPHKQEYLDSDLLPSHILRPASFSKYKQHDWTYQEQMIRHFQLEYLAVQRFGDVELFKNYNQILYEGLSNEWILVVREGFPPCGVKTRHWASEGPFAFERLFFRNQIVHTLAFTGRSSCAELIPDDNEFTSLRTKLFRNLEFACFDFEKATIPPSLILQIR